MESLILVSTFLTDSYTHFEMLVGVSGENILGAALALDTAFAKRQVGDKHQCSSGNTEGIANGKESGDLHINGNNSVLEDVIDELLVKGHMQKHA